MTPARRTAFTTQITQAKDLIAKGDLEASFPYLERAHVIGQQFVIPHATTHWLMLSVEFRRRRVMAVFGQIMRIVLGILGSAVGIVPVGNTGGTDVSMFKRMPIDPALQDVIDGVPPKSQA